MRTSLGQMNGDAWEDYCQKLLRLKYTDYQEVPAQFGGDLGIEGFTRSGIVFQCYSPDEDLGGVELYEKQRDKITRDIAKLTKNAIAISRLGVGEIREWHFLTPSYNNRELVSHCRKKENEVINKRLPQVNNNFQIYLRTENDYLSQIQQIIGTSLLKVNPLTTEPALDELDSLLNSENEIVLNIKCKLGRLLLPSAQSEQLVRDLVHSYVVGQNELEALNERFPKIYQGVVQLKAAKEKQLGIKVLSAQGGHGSILNQVLDEYEGKLMYDFSATLTSALITILSTEAIADWLRRCPLNFPALGSN